MTNAPAGKLPRPKNERRSVFQWLTHIPTPVIFIGSVAIAVIVLWLQGSLGDVAEAARDADDTVLTL